MERTLRRLRAIEEAGGEVLTLAADLADPAAVAAALAETERRFGSIDGVVHVAGLAEAGSARQALAAGIQGALALAAALAGRPLDLFVLAGSAAAVLGSPGPLEAAASAEAAAGAVFETLAALLARRGVPAAAILWDPAGGDAESALTASDRAEVFARVVESGLAQVVVSASPIGVRGRLGAVATATASGAVATATAWGALAAAQGSGAVAAAPASGAAATAAAWGAVAAAAGPDAVATTAVLDTAAPATASDTAAVEPANGGHPRPELANPYAPPQSELEREIAGIWREILGVDPIGLYDNFFELGGNSLAGLRVVGRLKERLQAGVSEVSLYEAPTVATLARLLGAAAPGESAAAAAPPYAGSRGRGEERRARQLRKARPGPEDPSNDPEGPFQ